MNLSSDVSAFNRLLRSPLRFRLFMFRNLPAACFSGLKMIYADEEKCTVSVPYTWFTRNPFRSTYFACLSMAGEMSTGILAMGNTYKKDPKVSLLVVSVEGKFHKKATAPVFFTCHDGKLFKEAVELAVLSGVPQTVKAFAGGVDKNGNLIAEFWISWSFKLRIN